MDFENWITMGAPDPRDEATKIKLRRVLYKESDAETHWEFQPIQSPSPPALDDPWIHNSIDAFAREHDTKMAGIRDEARNGINALLLGYLHRTDELLLAENGRDFALVADALLSSNEFVFVR